MKIAGITKVGKLAFVRVSGVILQFGILLTVGQLSGPQGVGAMQLFTAWTCSLGELSALGLPTDAMRRLSSANGNSTPAIRRLMLNYSGKIVVAWSLVALAVVMWASMENDYLASTGITPGGGVACLVAAVLAFALLRLTSESLKAIGHPNTSTFAETSGPPLVAGCILLALYMAHAQLQMTGIAVALGAGFMVSASFCIALLLSRRPKHSAGFGKIPERLTPARWREHGSFWATALISILFLNYPFLALPSYASIEELGQFAIAFKLLNLITTILIMLAALYGPRFARCDAADDIAGARRLLLQSRQVSVALYLPVMVFMLAAWDYLHPLFGTGFEGGLVFLAILAAGQLVNASVGLSGLLLNMMGRGRDEMLILAGTLLSVIALTPLAGEKYGAIGIVLVYATAIASKNILSFTVATRHLAVRARTTPQPPRTNLTNTTMGETS